MQRQLPYILAAICLVSAMCMVLYTSSTCAMRGALLLGATAALLCIRANPVPRAG